MKMVGTAFTTDEDREKWFHSLFEHRFSRTNELLLPDSQQYNLLESEEGLQTTFLLFARWTGVRTPHIKITYETLDSKSLYIIDKNHISIDKRLSGNVFAAGSILAQAFSEHALIKTSKQVCDIKTIEQLTLYFGLGAWIINGFPPNLSFSHKIYHAIEGNWHKTEGVLLKTYTDVHYTEHFLATARRRRVPAETYLPAIHSHVLHLFPSMVTIVDTRSLPNPRQVILHARLAKLMWIKLGLVTALFTSVIIFGALALPDTESNNSPTNETVNQQAFSLQADLAKCLDEARVLQNNYNTDDIYSSRAIESKKSECNSIRNEYDFVSR